MIQRLADRYSLHIAFLLLTLFYAEFVLAAHHTIISGNTTWNYNVTRSKSASPLFKWNYHNAGNRIENTTPKESSSKSIQVTHSPAKRPDVGGPTQPEMQAFQSVNSNNMVDLFSGDFSYNIPLMDVGGYPINIAYRSGISMDQDASWVGLGWNINPGTITRNMRGLPDDFSGETDKITKSYSIKENKTVGVTAGADLEIFGLPSDKIGVGIGFNLGVFKNNYKGWGLESGVNASVRVGAKSGGNLTGGLSLSNNSQEGFSATPSLSYLMGERGAQESYGQGSLSLSLPYSTRSGLKGLSLSAGLRQYQSDGKNQKNAGSNFSSFISFATPSYMPSIQNVMTNTNYTFTGKVGFEGWGLHPDFFISGYVSKQEIKPEDQIQTLPAYGYLNYQKAKSNPTVLLDYNREKEIPYREKPSVPNIAIPSYTYDAFSITGEGTGGMFRAYRGDIGYVYDHSITTKDGSLRGSVDVGFGNLAHGGVDLNLNRSYTKTGPWETNNSIKNTIGFKDADGLYEAAYFRNPGEKSINSKAFYDAVGGDDLVAVNLNQVGNTTSIIATNYLNKYQNGKTAGQTLLTNTNAIRQQRDKRTQVISYLNAHDAAIAGTSKYIENYGLNSYSLQNCGSSDIIDDGQGSGTGLLGQYYGQDEKLSTVSFTQKDPFINYSLANKSNSITQTQNSWPSYLKREKFSVKWIGRIKAPVTGTYIFNTYSDDGVRLRINDKWIIDNFTVHAGKIDQGKVNLVEGEFYDIELQYFQHQGDAIIVLGWEYPGQPLTLIPTTYLYPPATQDVFQINNALSIEKRTNTFRKNNHISEIDVLNTDGKRYVYGIPVYNLKQKEVTFSVDASKGSVKDGLVKYTPGQDNEVGKNSNEIDNYFSGEELPAYAHSFLLTSILSPDYVDVTGNGITDDDQGDAVKFNYTKVCGIANPYQWRTPYVTDSATYNEGLRSYNRDDKGSYVYGEKELWYLNSVVSKNMIATFKVKDRKDILPADENGQKNTTANYGKMLDEINLYTKADFLKNGTNATPVKTVHFEYSYELTRGINRPVNDSGKLTLKKIWFTYNGNNKGKLNPYVFYYHKNNPGYNTKAYDRWGNYKDPLQNPGSKSSDVINNAEYPYALQDSTLAAYNAAAWTMDSLRLPSGGKIKVTYESDDYAFVQNKRAAQMFKIAGFSNKIITSGTQDLSNTLFDKNTDNLYVYIKVSDDVASKKDVFNKYLKDLDQVYCKLYVKMPADQWGSGSEYVPCYAGIDKTEYGFLDAKTIWVKLKTIDKNGNEGGDISPLSKAALQFIKLNLPSKAYPGSETGDDMDMQQAVKVLLTGAANIQEAIHGFDDYARNNSLARYIDTSRSFVRLNNPLYKKYGGGVRVKRITIYDNWNAMTGKKESTYGQEYDYTTTINIDGKTTTISSGVAAWEPMIGGEENPFHLPLQYSEKVAPLAPVNLGYVELPLGESFYPGAGVGYSKVKVRSIHAENVRSGTGYEETGFYTAYDFPTYSECTMLDDNTKKRYASPLAKLLRINVKNYIAVSQGFKIELNDMHGKQRSHAVYAQQAKDPLSYTETFYKATKDSRGRTILSNTVWTIDPQGNVDTTSVIGKDVEIMADMRDQTSITNANNLNVNGDGFMIGIWPAFIPTLINLAQREERVFRSAAVTKVIQRYGIADSIIHIEKGSRITTGDMLYDSETGQALLSRTQNEFNDPVYNFTYPSHWAYDGMGLAYKNIGATLQHITIRQGKIINSLNKPASDYFSSGDEILVAGKQKTGSTSNPCIDSVSTFSSYTKIWAVDANVIDNNATGIYFIDADGKPYSAYDVTLTNIRSGRRNILTGVGSVTTLKNPLVQNADKYNLVLNTDSKVLNAAANEYKQVWKVNDQKAQKNGMALVPVSYPGCTSPVKSEPPLLQATAPIMEIRQDTAYTTRFDSLGNLHEDMKIVYDTVFTKKSPLKVSVFSCGCNCLQNFFRYLIANKKLFIKQSDNVTVGTLIAQANTMGYPVDVNSCEQLKLNQNKPFFAITTDSVSTNYKAKLGDCIVNWNSYNGSINFYKEQYDHCNDNGVYFGYNETTPMTNTVDVTESLVWSNVLNQQINTNANNLTALRMTALLKRTYLRFNIPDDYSVIPSNASFISAKLYLYAYPGTLYTGYANAHTISPNGGYTLGIGTPSFLWDKNTDPSLFDYSTPFLYIPITGVNDNLVVDISSIVSQWVQLSRKATKGLVFFNNNTGATSGCSFHSQNDCYKASDLKLEWKNTCPKLEINYSIPTAVTTSFMTIESCTRMDTVYTNSCVSIITDTLFNPYTSGVLGNWRVYKGYTYYSNRAETDLNNTNIRKDGAFNDFAPFWQWQSNNLKPVYDDTRWVWNAEQTKFNKKGMELENKDPLGRYNAGIYGYGLTLPVAVSQNSRYRETAFEGFEDYDFATQECTRDCPAERHFDFSAYKSKFSNLQAHTGKVSLRLAPGEDAGITATAVTEANADPEQALMVNMASTSCFGNTLKEVKTNAGSLLPIFSPVAGQKFVVSLWVKEEQQCTALTYTNNQVAIVVANGQTYTCNPKGSIIEGWQQYEQVIELPANATALTLSLKATGSTAVYFDDIRIHPYNANMKSFVYDPVTLRLMAELDENNFASFYEYDDDGTLIRVKKETERGIKTIKETRSALLKEEE